MKRRVDMIPFGFRDDPPPPQPPPPSPPSWPGPSSSAASGHFSDFGPDYARTNFVGLDAAGPSSRLLLSERHHSLLSDYASQSSSSASSVFGYSQKNFHISDGTLYSILSPFQSRRSTSRPSFLRGHATVTSTTPSPRAERARKAKLKFHHHEVPPSYRNSAIKRAGLDIGAGIEIPSDRSAFTSTAASGRSSPLTLGDSRRSSWFDDVRSSMFDDDDDTLSLRQRSRTSGSRGLSSVLSKHIKPEDDRDDITDKDAMDLSQKRDSFFSSSSSRRRHESENYSLSSMRSFKRDLFSAASNSEGSIVFLDDEDDDEDEEDEDTPINLPLNLCLADLRRSTRPKVTVSGVSATCSAPGGIHIKEEHDDDLYFDDDDSDDDESDTETGIADSFSEFPRKRRFSVPEAFSDSFRRFHESHSPSADSNFSESSHIFDDRPEAMDLSVGKAKRHLQVPGNIGVPPPAPAPATPKPHGTESDPPTKSTTKTATSTATTATPTAVPSHTKETPPYYIRTDIDDGEVKPTKSPRIAEMLQNMSLRDDDLLAHRTFLERYAATRERLLATHPEMFVSTVTPGNSGVIKQPNILMDEAAKLHNNNDTTAVYGCWSTGEPPPMFYNSSGKKPVPESAQGDESCWNTSPHSQLLPPLYPYQFKQYPRAATEEGCGERSSSSSKEISAIEKAKKLIEGPKSTSTSTSAPVSISVQICEAADTETKHAKPPLAESVTIKDSETSSCSSNLPFLRTRSSTPDDGNTGARSKTVDSSWSERGGRSHHPRHTGSRSGRRSRSDSPSHNNSPYANDINICKFKLIKGVQPILEEKKSFYVNMPRTSSNSERGKMFDEGASTSSCSYQQQTMSAPVSASSSSSSLPPTGLPSSTSDSFRTYKIHVGSQEDMGRKLAAGKRLRRRSRKALAREKLEATFREQGFLIKTQQVASAEGAVYCKFRQLKKFTRYLYKSWRDYLPKELEEMQAMQSGISRNQSF